MLVRVTLVTKLPFLTINSIFFNLKQSFFFAHLVGELLKHSDLLACFFIHDLGLLTDFGVNTVFGSKSSARVAMYFLFEPGNAVVFFRVVLAVINTKLVLSLLNLDPNSSCMLFDLIVEF